MTAADYRSLCLAEMRRTAECRRVQGFRAAGAVLLVGGAVGAALLAHTLDHASGAMTLPCGKVSVRWVQSADAVTVDVTLPADKTAELSLYGQTVALHGGENHHVISKPQ